jgi:hypothetical protein
VRKDEEHNLSAHLGQEKVSVTLASLRCSMRASANFWSKFKEKVRSSEEQSNSQREEVRRHRKTREGQTNIDWYYEC